MKVTVYDVDQPDKEVGGKYLIDTTYGLPLPGDHICLRERDYNTDRYYLTAVVRHRRWVFNDNTPGNSELQVWVQRHGPGK